MISTNFFWMIVFLMLIKVGILGNSFLFCFYTFTTLIGQNLRPVDQILNQLVSANCIVLFSKGVPQEMVAIGLRDFLDDSGCKLLFYLYRVARGISLGTACLLAGFQALTLCPGVSKRMELRGRISFCCYFCWLLNFLINIHVAIKVKGPVNSKNTSLETASEHCTAPATHTLAYLLLASMVFLVDCMCLGFMVWASSSMVFVLYRHKQRVQHIHSHTLSPRPAREDKATHTILILVSMYVVFYCLSSILTLLVSLSRNPAKWLVDTSVFLALCFPAFSPLALITSDGRVSKLCFAWWVNPS